MFDRDHFIIILFLIGFTNIGFAQQTSVEVCFSPRNNCIKKIEERINQAKKSIRMFAYSFKSKALANTLIKAHNRGVQVDILFDHTKVTSAKKTKKIALYLKQNKVTVDYFSSYYKQHNKAITIDGETVITGSLNFSQNNDTYDNIVFIRNNALATEYTNLFHTMIEKTHGKKR